MIDSVSLVWGHAIGTASLRAADPRLGFSRRAEPLAPPIYLDWRDLIERLGGDDGQVREIRYGNSTPTFGHWQAGHVELLYREGRVELRASLPKLLTGRNDCVLDERTTHEGLRELVLVGEELCGHPLNLREAVPTRLDYCYQWQVPSVAFVLEHVKSAFAPARKARTEWITVKGGRSLNFGYGGRSVLRFYDKVAEVREHGEVSTFDLDTLLRFEIQERRRPRLRLVHEQGYTADAVRGELTRAVQALGAVSMQNVERLLEERHGQWQHGLAYAMGALFLAEHEEAFPVIRRVVNRNTYYRWRRRAREVALAVADWSPVIPPDAFSSSGDLWARLSADAA